MRAIIFILISFFALELSGQKRAYDIAINQEQDPDSVYIMLSETQPIKYRGGRFKSVNYTDWVNDLIDTIQSYGGGENISNAALTFDGDYVHNANHHSIEIDSISIFYLAGTNVFDDYIYFEDSTSMEFHASNTIDIFSKHDIAITGTDGISIASNNATVQLVSNNVGNGGDSLSALTLQYQDAILQADHDIDIHSKNNTEIVSDTGYVYLSGHDLLNNSSIQLDSNAAISSHNDVIITCDEDILIQSANILSIVSDNNDINITANDTLNITSLRLKLLGLPVYADEAAAGVGGLTENTVYRTSTGEIRIKLP